MSYGVLDAKLWDQFQRLTVSWVLLLVDILLATNLIYRIPVYFVKDFI
jgi:hypothetical protein